MSATEGTFALLIAPGLDARLVEGVGTVQNESASVADDLEADGALVGLFVSLVVREVMREAGGFGGESVVGRVQALVV